MSRPPEWLVHNQSTGRGHPVAVTGSNLPRAGWPTVVLSARRAGGITPEMGCCYLRQNRNNLFSLNGSSTRSWGQHPQTGLASTHRLERKTCGKLGNPQKEGFAYLKTQAAPQHRGSEP